MDCRVLQVLDQQTPVEHPRDEADARRTREDEPQQEKERDDKPDKVDGGKPRTPEDTSVEPGAESKAERDTPRTSGNALLAERPDASARPPAAPEPAVTRPSTAPAGAVLPIGGPPAAPPVGHP